MSIELRTVGQLDTRRASYSTLTQGSGIGFVYVTKITWKGGGVVGLGSRTLDF